MGNPRNRLIVNQGGTRSSKTYSIAQLFVLKALREKGKLFTICRRTMPALRATAMRDFFEVLKSMNLYSESNHNKSSNSYKLGNSEVEFISVDEPQKIRGRKRKYLWLNEANEFRFEDYRQLILRTTGQIFLDYNPSDEYHWIYDEVLTRDDCFFIKSTYHDNPFLDDVLIKEIERLKGTDPNYWKIYGEGERGVSVNKIYSHWDYIDELPEGGDKIYGLDFGYNNPSALAEIRIKDDEVYARERIYRSFLTNRDLIMLMKGYDRLNAEEKKEWDNVNIETRVSREDRKKARIESMQDIIYADSAEPQRIEEFRRSGFNIREAKKDVALGIDSVKRRKLFITKDSVNGLKEIKAYSWKVDKDEKITDDPVKVNDHFMDDIRYAVYTHTGTGIPRITVL